MSPMVYIVGAGPGAPDLITVRGMKLLQKADVIIYAGSLVNPELLKQAREGCRIFDSAKMTLEQVVEVIEEAYREGKLTVRLHTGDPCLYGAIREQMDEMDRLGIPYEICPGVSSFCGAAAALGAEYTLPGVSQSVVITRMAGGYGEDTPAAIVYRATWPDERVLRCRVSTLAKTARDAGVSKTALIIVGETVAQRGYERSRLYDPSFTTEYRKGETT